MLDLVDSLRLGIVDRPLSRISGQDIARDRLVRATKGPRAVLVISGPPGSGKYALARAAAQGWLCTESAGADYCGHCDDCATFWSKPDRFREINCPDKGRVEDFAALAPQISGEQRIAVIFRSPEDIVPKAARLLEVALKSPGKALVIFLTSDLPRLQARLPRLLDYCDIIKTQPFTQHYLRTLADAAVVSGLPIDPSIRDELVAASDGSAHRFWRSLSKLEEGQPFDANAIAEATAEPEMMVAALFGDDRPKLQQMARQCDPESTRAAVERYLGDLLEGQLFQLPAEVPKGAVIEQFLRTRGRRSSSLLSEMTAIWERRRGPLTQHQLLVNIHRSSSLLTETKQTEKLTSPVGIERGALIPAPGSNRYLEVARVHKFWWMGLASAQLTGVTLSIVVRIEGKFDSSMALVGELVHRLYMFERKRGVGESGWIYASHKFAEGDICTLCLFTPQARLADTLAWLGKYLPSIQGRATARASADHSDIGRLQFQYEALRSLSGALSPAALVRIGEGRAPLLDALRVPLSARGQPSDCRRPNAVSNRYIRFLTDLSQQRNFPIRDWFAEGRWAELQSCWELDAYRDSEFARRYPSAEPLDDLPTYRDNRDNPA